MYGVLVVFNTSNKSGDWNKFVNFVTNPIPEDLLKSQKMSQEDLLKSDFRQYMDASWICALVGQASGSDRPGCCVVVLTEMPGI